MSFVTNPENVVSEDAAFYTCATDAKNVNLPQKAKLLLQWHYRLGHCSIKLVRWLASKGIIRGSVDSSSNILCDSCRIARGSRRPVDVELPDKQMKSKLAPTVKSIMKGIKGNDLKPGDCISIDQYQSSRRGRLATGFGKTASNMTDL